MTRFACVSVALAALAAPAVAGLGDLPPDVLSKEQAADAKGAISRDLQKRTREFNARHLADWAKVADRAAWEKYRDERIARLRASLADWPAAPKKLDVRTTSAVRGDGFVVENLVYQSRPGFWVAGNLYGPTRPGKSMPGILLAHAHHNGKRHNELQDMGMTWARAGCLVLVIDQVGYGERRAHPFHAAKDFAKPYRTGRQDYYFRYDSGVQLQLMGDSLMGWMAWDLMRGVDLLLARPGIDAKRIVLVGGVAGGGDPAGVTAALDERVTCVVPFNFGGPQPETKYPLPDDAETSFNYLQSSYWDSTRGLRLGASGDFPHWVITASVAPRYLIHGHEFSWDGERDPVWKRYKKVWGDFYGKADRIGVAHGKGLLSGQAPAASHCGHVGEFHRRMIHPLFAKWFEIDAKEYGKALKGEDLVCLDEATRKALEPKSLNETAGERAAARVAAARARREGKTPAEARLALRDDWAKLLGPVTPGKPAVKSSREEQAEGAKVERVVLEVEPGFVLPVLVLSPKGAKKGAPAVVAVAQAGKAGFLKARAAEVEKLLAGGAVVVLPDLRGTGETASGTSRGRDSAGTDQSTRVQLFGETLVGQRLRDLRSVLAYVRSRPEVDAKGVSVWGDSFAPRNAAKTDFVVPHAADGWPAISEPLGGLLGLLAALFDDDVKAVFVSGGLSELRSVLSHFAVLVPHDACVPGALTAGELCDLAAAVAPRPLHFEEMVDHKNRPVGEGELRREYAPAVKAYAGRQKGLTFSGARTSAAEWLLR